MPDDLHALVSWMVAATHSPMGTIPESVPQTYGQVADILKLRAELDAERARREELAGRVAALHERFKRGSPGHIHDSGIEYTALCQWCIALHDTADLARAHDAAVRAKVLEEAKTVARSVATEYESINHDNARGRVAGAKQVLVRLEDLA